MARDGTIGIAVVCEAPADQRIACGLADRVILEQVDWITPETLDDYRAWRGISEGTTFIAWHDMKKERRQRAISERGPAFSAPRKLSMGRAAAGALQVFMSMNPRPDGVMLTADADRDPERTKGIGAARGAPSGWPFAVVVGIANPNREAWVLCGFDPTEREKPAFDRVVRDISCDPRDHSHELTQKLAHEPRNTKRVLLSLAGGDESRENRCWSETPLSTLRSRGGGNGLAAFLSELRDHIVPLFTSQSPSTE